MTGLIFILKASAPIFLAVGALHLAYGMGADILLGAKPGNEALLDPVLDSQNRFYGIAFTVYGGIFWMAAGDLNRYAPMLKMALAVFFAAGLARLVAISVTGMPSELVLGLLGSELILPPLLWVLANKALNEK